MDSITRIRRIVDHRSRPIETAFEYDTDGDGTPNRIWTIREMYDRHGNPTLRVDEVDRDADGTVDYVPTRIMRTY